MQESLSLRLSYPDTHFAAKVTVYPPRIIFNLSISLNLNIHMCVYAVYTVHIYRLGKDTLPILSFFLLLLGPDSVVISSGFGSDCSSPGSPRLHHGLHQDIRSKQTCDKSNMWKSCGLAHHSQAYRIYIGLKILSWFWHTDIILTACRLHKMHLSIVWKDFFQH